MVIQRIASRLVEEASFLWFLRAKAVSAPHFSLHDLAGLDERLEAQVDGLRVAGEPAWEMCKATLESSEPEWLFAATLLAIDSGNKRRIQEVLESVGQERSRARPVISALGWLPYPRVQSTLDGLVAAETPMHRYIGLAAHVAHRQDPADHLDQAIADASPLIKARALRAYGELGRCRESHLFSLRGNLNSNDEATRFSAAWSAALVGNAEAVEVLKTFVTTGSPFQEKAINVALRGMQWSDALAWRALLAQSPDTIRLAITGAGIIGDPALIPWLLEQMAFAPQARLAGEAFTMITGVDLAGGELEAARPEGFNAGPDDDPTSDNVTMDPEAELSWPDREMIGTWWHHNRGRYQSGVRYLLGKPITAGHLQRVLQTGRLRQRAAAALELAMMHPGQPLFEVRAPGFRQKVLL